MIRKLIKLPFKIAFLPLKIASKLAKMFMGGGDTGAGFAGAPTTGVSSPAPAPPEPSEPSEPSPSTVEVDPAVVLGRLKDGDKLTFIDVREAGELAATGKIEDALHIPLRDLPRRFEELDAEEDFVVYCAAGMRSLDAALFLRDKGFDKVFSLAGGLPHWQQDGGDVVAI
jgi:rhodanese-related sulfurtransferase